MARFGQNFNCAQAVFSSFAAQYGIDEDSALRMTSPFGGGIGRSGNVCGAISGALLAFGLKYGSSTPEGKEETYRRTQDFLQRCIARQGSILCRDLIQCDISTPEGMSKAKESGVFQQVCPKVIREVIETLESFSL
jgi:C_GCAxxG_C_C family probable redox protein